MSDKHQETPTTGTLTGQPTAKDAHFFLTILSNMRNKPDVSPLRPVLLSYLLSSHVNFRSITQTEIQTSQSNTLSNPFRSCFQTHADTNPHRLTGRLLLPRPDTTMPTPPRSASAKLRRSSDSTTMVPSPRLRLPKRRLRHLELLALRRKR